MADENSLHPNGPRRGMLSCVWLPPSLLPFSLGNGVTHIQDGSHALTGPQTTTGVLSHLLGDCKSSHSDGDDWSWHTCKCTTEFRTSCGMCEIHINLAVWGRVAKLRSLWGRRKSTCKKHPQLPPPSHIDVGLTTPQPHKLQGLRETERGRFFFSFLLSRDN